LRRRRLGLVRRRKKKRRRGRGWVLTVRGGKRECGEACDLVEKQRRWCERGRGRGKSLSDGEKKKNRKTRRKEKENESVRAHLDPSLLVRS